MDLTVFLVLAVTVIDILIVVMNLRLKSLLAEGELNQRLGTFLSILPQFLQCQNCS